MHQQRHEDSVEPIDLDAEYRAFEALKARLTVLWREIFPSDDQPYTSIVVPSLSLEPSLLERRPEVLHLEETLLFLLIRLRNPHARVTYLTSEPIPPAILDYYLQFLASVPSSHARARLTLLSPHDGSKRPLTQKILERPRLLARIRATIRDPARAYLTVLHSTPLERRLAVALQIPLNAADAGMESLCTKSSARRLFREAGVEVPHGFEDLKTREEIVDALVALRRSRPGLGAAVLKLNTSYWDEGHAVVRLSPEGSRCALHDSLAGLRPSDPSETAEGYLERFSRAGGVVEEFVEAPFRRATSVQVRINPLGRVFLTSTHDEIRTGPSGMETGGCRFPADGAYRPALQATGMRLGQILADRGLVSRVSVELLATRADPLSPWRLAGSEINLGVGGSTHPLLAVRFLSDGQLDPGSGEFLSSSGRPKYYRATDRLEAEAYKSLTPDDLIEVLTMSGLNYSHRSERGALLFMLGGIAELGRVGLLAVGNTPAEAEEVFRRTTHLLDVESGRP